MSSCRVYLVPGFFGFTTLGNLSYFLRVRETLDSALRARGVTPEIISCPTQPTGSITRRTDRLIGTVLETGGAEAGPVHFVGHSTGGLDVRLLLTPGVRIRESRAELKIAEATRTAVTISTPHFGTPLANFFTTVQGRQVLQLLTVIATSRPGRRSAYWGAQLIRLLARADDLVGRTDTFLDEVGTRFLESVGDDPTSALWTFLDEVSRDQGAVIQLTPEGMHLYNAAVVDRPGVAYGCVLTAAPAPGARDLSRMLRPGRILTSGVFAALYALAAREHRHYPYPSPAERMRHRVESQLPFALDTRTNDAVVPTLSQMYGELIDVVVGDHLDVVGQFYEAGGHRYADWLPSGAGFGEERFQRVWGRVADFIAGA